MPQDLNGQQEPENPPQPHHHHCGNLFGCGEEKGTGVLREDIKDAAFTKRAADRLLHMDEINQEQLDGYLTARGRSRRRLLGASTRSLSFSLLNNSKKCDTAIPRRCNQTQD